MGGLWFIKTSGMKDFKVLFLLILVMAGLTGCHDEEWDEDGGHGVGKAVVEGVVTSSYGAPVEGVKLSVDFFKGDMLASVLRHKGEAVTDENGRYSITVNVRSDEQGSDGHYSLSADLAALSPDRYAMPSDFVAVFTSDSPLPKPHELDAKMAYTLSGITPNESLTQNIYIPQKRMVQVTLKCFTVGEGNRFEVQNSFSYGMELPSGEGTAGGKYAKSTADYFWLLDKHEQTFNVPFAIGEENTVRILRKVNGTYSWEDEKIKVTDSYPQSLTYEY